MSMIAHIESVAEAWVGLRSARPTTEIERAGWQPDEQAVYCRRCGASVGEGEATVRGCAACRHIKRPHVDRVFRLGRYDGALRTWILGVKYERWAEMGRSLGRLLGEQIATIEPIDDPALTIVVPIPMPWQRRMYRGIDHTQVIASGVARALGVDLFRMLRKTNGPAQVELPASERRSNMRNRLYLKRRLGGWPVDDLHVILIDDVRTSGATIDAAARVIRTLKPKRLTAAVLAVADEASRQARSADLPDTGPPEGVLGGKLSKQVKMENCARSD